MRRYHGTIEDPHGYLDGYTVEFYESSDGKWNAKTYDRNGLPAIDRIYGLDSFPDAFTMFSNLRPHLKIVGLVSDFDEWQLDYMD